MSLIHETFLEYPSNSDLAAILYMQGCDKNCMGCHNTDLKEWKETDEDVIEELEEFCERIDTDKIVLCGGDPLYRKNLDITKKILKRLGKEYKICIYTGSSIEEVKKLKLKGFEFIKCGIYNKNKYVGSEKTDDYIRFATSNQELYSANYKLLSKDGIYYFRGN